MSNKRSVFIFAGLTLLAIAVVAFTVRTTTVAPKAADVSNAVLPHPAGDIPLAAVEASDYFERHPRGDMQRTSDVPSAGAEASDYFQRHPEVLRSADPVDLSDYIQRHPETLASTGAADVSDWFERHPEVVHQGSAPDLSDWFQRHPDSLVR